MTDLLVCLTVLAAACVLAWRVYAPPRSVIWRNLKLWAEDNELAADLRETRRALRRQVKPRSTVTQLDNGREFQVEGR